MDEGGEEPSEKGLDFGFQDFVVMHAWNFHFPGIEYFDMVFAKGSFVVETEINDETIGEGVLVAFLGVDDVALDDSDAYFADVFEFLFTGMRIIDMFGDFFAEQDLGIGFQ